MDFPKSVPGVGLVNGVFVDEDELAGKPGSLIPSAWGNSVTVEILNVLYAAGIDPDETKTNQLAQAIAAISRVSEVTWDKITEAPTTLGGYGIEPPTQPEALAGADNTLPMTALRVKGVLNARGFWDNSIKENSNANLPRSTGLYSLFGATNSPPGGSFQMLSSDWGADPNWQAQLALGVGANGVYARSIKKDQSAALPWEKLYSSSDFVLTGASVGFYLSAPPVGWLKENGAAVSRTTYAALFAVIGTAFGAGDGSTTFNLPDHRGEFPRGTDDSRGVDPGRLVGSTQAQAIQSHSHPILDKAVAFSFSAAAGGNAPGNRATGATELTGGTETRPRNIAKLYCIKY